MTAEPAVESDRPSDFRPLLVIVLAGLALRIGVWLWLGGGTLHIWDEREYDQLATNLVLDGEFAFHSGQPTSLRPPLYPALVAAVYWVLGVESYGAVWLLQSLLSTVTLLVVHGIGSAVFSRRVGLWAAGLAAGYPALLIFNNLLLTETLFTTFLCSACLGVLLAVQRGSWPWAAAAGLLLGLGALTRSILWPFSIPLALFVFAAWRGSLASRLLGVSALLLAFVVTIAPWTIRNTRLEHTFQTIDCMGGRNCMMGNYAFTPKFRAWDAISEKGDREWIAVLRASHPEVSTATQGQLDKVALKSAVAFVRANPAVTVERDLAKFFAFWEPERDLISGAARGYFGTMSPAALVLFSLLLLVTYAGAFFSGLFGALLARPIGLRGHALLLLIMTFTCAVHTVTFGHPRYHLPLMPLILVYSAAAIVHRREILARRWSPQFAAACGLCVVFLAGWMWITLGEDWGRLVP